MRPGSFYSSFEKHVLDLRELDANIPGAGTPNVNLFITNLNTLGSLGVVTAANLEDTDYVKIPLYNILKKIRFNTGVIALTSSGNSTGWTMNTPAQLIDAGGKNTLNKEEFLNDLIKINQKINNNNKTTDIAFAVVSNSITYIANNNVWTIPATTLTKANAEQNFIHLKPIWSEQPGAPAVVMTDANFINRLDQDIFEISTNKFHYEMDQFLGIIASNEPITKLYRVMHNNVNILHKTLIYSNLNFILKDF